jgi:hypothetical protein
VGPFHGPGIEPKELVKRSIGADRMMRPLAILWQRLVNSRGETCDRCGLTFAALQRALKKLNDVLGPLDIEPSLETIAMQEPSFRADPSGSNRIWIAGKPLEEWLGGRAGSSRCCSVCGDAECRTLEVGGTVFEAIPEHLILQAALIAAAHMLEPTGEAPSPHAVVCSCGTACCAEAL